MKKYIMIVAALMVTTANAGWFGLNSDMSIDDRIKMHQSMRDVENARLVQEQKLDSVVNALEAMTAKQNVKDAKIAAEADFLRMFNKAQAAQATQALLTRQMKQLDTLLQDAENTRLAKQAHEEAKAQKAIMRQMMLDMMSETTG